MIDLLEVSESYTLRLSNILLVLGAIAFFVLARLLVKKFINRSQMDQDISISGKDISVKKVIHQLVYIITSILLYGSIAFGHPKFALSNILGYDLVAPSGQFDGISIGTIFAIVIIIFGTRILVNLIRIFIVKGLKERDWIDDGRTFTLVQLSRYLIYTISALIILKLIVGDISTFLLGGTALFVGLGLGLQEFFTDIVSGFILLNDGSIKVGDIVEINGEIARVQKISLRTSHIKTTEGKIMIVPNSKFTEELVTNWSISDKVNRFHINVSVAYGTDTQLVKNLLYDIALKHPKVEKNREILIMFDNFGDNGLEFQLYFWAKQAWEIRVMQSELRFEIDKQFRENSITIPFPQRDLHIKSGSL
ncbi:MAG: small-conductance mechanosensitive channel [Flavobacteriales bacterium]|jgi:small-conductance mechanosensitive channel